MVVTLPGSSMSSLAGLRDACSLSPRVLVVDIGGNNVKLLASGQKEPRKVASGPLLTPTRMMEDIGGVITDWDYDVVSVGYPGPVRNGRPFKDPHNLGASWVEFDFEAAFDRPVKIVNDAAMQALGSYRGGSMLFLGLGTGLGSALILDDIVQPLELGHLPYKKSTFEDYVGQRGLDSNGKKEWRNDVADVVARLAAAIQPDDIVIGGGNVKKLKDLPPNTRAGDNIAAFEGGFRLWEN